MPNDAAGTDEDEEAETVAQRRVKKKTGSKRLEKDIPDTKSKKKARVLVEVVVNYILVLINTLLLWCFNKFISN